MKKKIKDLPLGSLFRHPGTGCILFYSPELMEGDCFPLSKDNNSKIYISDELEVDVFEIPKPSDTSLAKELAFSILLGDKLAGPALLDLLLDSGVVDELTRDRLLDQSSTISDQTRAISELRSIIENMTNEIYELKGEVRHLENLEWERKACE